MYIFISIFSCSLALYKIQFVLHIDFVYCDIAKFTYFSLISVDFLVFLSRTSCYLSIKEYVIYLFPIYMVLFFSSFIYQMRISTTIFFTSSGNGFYCLVNDLRGKIFTYSPLRMVKVVYMPLINLVYYEFFF